MKQNRSLSSVVIDRSTFVIDRQGSIGNFYKVAPQKLGEGGFGQVMRAVNLITKEVRAVKKMSKAACDVKLFRMEVAMLKRMDHPNVVRLHEVCEDNAQVFLVTELCDGGELFERLMATPGKHLGELDASAIMQDLLRALAYMHCVNIAHRDVKPENVMLQSKGSLRDNIAKLIDFGTACPCFERSVMKTKVGTPYYVAPEVLDMSYGRECDLWSAGATMYLLLSGSLPFSGRTDAEILRQVRRAQYNFSRSIWSLVSDCAKDMIRRLMNVLPVQRCTADLALNSQWIANTAPRRPAALTHKLLERLRLFGLLGPLRKATLQVLASKLDDSKLKHLREQAGMDRRSDLAQLVATLDTNQRRGLNYSEYLAAALDPETCMDRDSCFAAFNVFDIDGDGTITAQELGRALGMNVSEESRAEELLQQADRNGDGVVDFQEFLQFMKGPANSAVDATPVLGTHVHSL